ncbi:hypothetical protein [Streptomyces sp. NPDC004658]|uniref:hypothetical protein n=1 Tax=Streptomyces sp. NPDC004658 TaxID=3154672 RepID=UPI0033ABDBEB
MRVPTPPRSAVAISAAALALSGAAADGGTAARHRETGHRIGRGLGHRAARLPLRGLLGPGQGEVS